MNHIARFSKTWATGLFWGKLPNAARHVIFKLCFLFLLNAA